MAQSKKLLIIVKRMSIFSGVLLAGPKAGESFKSVNSLAVLRRLRRNIQVIIYATRALLNPCLNLI